MSTLDAAPPVSTRVQIARLAERVVARCSGVSATRSSGRWLTLDGERAIDGIVVARTPAGRVEVELHLIATWPPEPLPPLAEQLRRELVATAGRSGLGERLGEIEVFVHDVQPAAAGPGERP
jgi:hypothetical protein